MFQDERSMPAVPHATVVEGFAARAAATPDAVALVCGGRTLTYRELDRWAAELAGALAERGVGAESRVGLLLARSAEVVVAMLAVLKAGAVYVPLHPDSPEERTRSLLTRSRAVLVLTDQDRSTVAGFPALRADASAAGSSPLPAAAPLPDALAYVMFTSGSTGVPKGVAVPHAAVTALAADSRWQGGAHTHVLFHSPHSFDAATYEIWVPLLRGGTVTVAEEEISPSVLRRAVAGGVTAVFLTKALFDLLAEEDPECFAGLREVWTGGEAASPAAMARVQQAVPELALVHVYGPTETTTFAVCGTLSPADTRDTPVPLGSAMDGTGAHILDAALAPVPVGTAGELYLGGTGLARGYDGRPDLTATRFVPDPERPGGRLYRTGDLVRRRPDGRIDFLGRTDTQVKIRGHRIEPAEIETALLADPAVTRACVVAREDRPGARRLVAYLVATAPQDPSALRDRLARTLPEYMVPAAFVTLDTLPLTPNGKIDQRALPAPGPATAQAPYRAPRDETERALCELWAGLLGVERAGADDDFFALGGDSVTALKALSRLRRTLGADLPARTLFDHPTPAALAAVLARESTGTAAVPAGQIPAAPRDGGPLPLSPGQERLWFLDAFAPGGVEYNTGLALRVAGGLDLTALRGALDGLTARHEPLRTSFAEDGQTVHPALPLPLRAVDADGEEELRQVLAAEQATPFDLRTGPPARVLVVRLAHQEATVLVLTVHHIVTDGWSMGIITRELSTLYTAAVRGERAALAPLPVRYADFAAWQRERVAGDAFDGQLAYWREKLAGTEPLDLPTDRPRPAVRTTAGALHTFEVPAELADRLTTVAREGGASLFMALTAVTQLLLSRHTGQRDIALGTVVAGRERPEVEELAGFFVNTLVLRQQVPAALPFGGFLRQVRATVLDAFAHQEAPFDRVVEAVGADRDPSRTPLVQALLVLQNSLDIAPDFAGRPARRQPVPRASSRFDLLWEFFAEPDGRLSAEVEYNADLFDAATVERLGRHWLALAGQAVRTPALPLARLTPQDAAERAALLPPSEAPEEGTPFRTVVELVAERVAAAPEAVALRHGDTSVPYAELGRRSDQLARHLLALGAGPERRIGISLPRTPDLVIAALAVLKTGAAYVPLDPEYPADRLRHMRRESGVHLTVDEAVVAGALAADDSPVPSPALSPANAAYVIHTSGSTGRPKGVVVAHEAMSRLVTWATTLGEETFAHTFFSTSLNFDVSVFELFGTLAAGGTLEIAHDILSLTDHPVWDGTLVSAVPSAVAAVLDDPTTRLRPKLLVLAGEAFPATLLDTARRTLPGATVANIYGPTEATVYATGWFSDTDPAPEGATVPIGRALAGKGAYVLDATLNPVPDGVRGELYLAGSLARGYHGQPGLTAARFVAHPYDAGQRLYRTGDLVRRRPDGTLEYAGRNDQQIKIRGHRVETGEIETVLTGHPEIARSVVVLREDTPGTKYLAAYLVPADGAAPDVAGVRAHLAGALPGHMVPAAFVTLDALPLNAAGKLDRAALPAPHFTADTTAYTAPRTETERLLAGIWAEVLGREQVGCDDNFFDLGGDSIISLQVVSRARRAGLALTSRDIFLHPTVAALAARTGEAATEPESLAEQGVVSGEVATTPIREWFFATHPAAPHHFHMGAGFLLPAGTDLTVLRAAVAAVLERHDALRSTFTRAADGGWAGRIAATLDVDEVFTPVADEGDAAWAALTARVQAGTELAKGPLVRVLVRTGGSGVPPQVLIAAHHLVMDGVSWRVLLEDLESAYRRIEQGAEPAYGPKGTSVRQWAERLAGHTTAGHFDGELPYWEDVLAEAATRLPVDRPGGDNTVGSERTVSVGLTAEETEALLHAVPSVYRTRPNDVLLAALARTLGPWAGGGRLAVHVEGHGRAELFEDVDLTRTVGWFTSLHPVTLDLAAAPEDGDWRELLPAVKERLRSVPGQGVGYGALRYLRAAEPGPAGDRARALAASPAPELAFNYLGHFGTADDSGWARSLVLNPGGEHDPDERRGHVLEVVGAVQDGRLTFTWAYSGTLHERATVAALAERYAAELRGLLAHCASPGAGRCTPSDFPLVRLTQEEVDRVTLGDGEGRGPREVADVYPLTPLQSGMLFHALNDPEQGSYLEQFTFVLDGADDLDALAGAWGQVINASDALRVSLAWAGLPEPVQVVHREVRVPVARLDWSGRTEAECAALLTALLAEDRAAGMDLAGDGPLTRVALAALPGGGVRVVWTFHHLLLDGWSSAAVVADVVAAYAAARGGEPARLPVRGAFRDHLAWLAGRDRAAGLAFWRDRLAGFTAPTALPYDRAPGEAHRTGSTGRFATRLGADASAAVTAAARRHRVTPGTLAQAAWALTLAAHAGTPDVVFGTTVSGRPAGLPGAESTVGLFINTVPVRVTALPGEPVGPWLRRIGAAQAGADEYAHVPLHEISAGLPGPAALFDSLLVVENYPVATGEAAGHGVTVRELDAVESTNYPLTLTVRPSGSYELTAGYDPALFDADTAERLTEGFLRALTALAEETGEENLAALPLLAGTERARVMGEWSGGLGAATEDSSVPGAFALRVAATPDAPAVRCGTLTYTYRELDARADRVAAALRRRGAGAGARVGLLLRRSPDVVVAMLAVLKTGAAYVPLHAAHPVERMEQILGSAGAQLLLADAAAPHLPAGVGVLRLADATRRVTDPAEAGAGSPARAVPADEPAYVMSTSGSTGTPKGVTVTHRAVVSLAADRRWESGAHRHVLFHSPHSFDAATYEVWVPLLNGGCVEVAEEDLSAPVVRRAAGRGVTAVFLTTALFGALAEEDPACFAGLREVWTGGEAASAPAMARMAAHCPGTELVHVYGPTEATTFALCGPVTPDDTARPRPVPLGRPMDETLAYVLDGALRPVGVGVPGELYLGGPGLARGYDGQSALTSARFVADPFGSGRRLYRSGDVVRRGPDGRLAFLGRGDGQVKIRGHRVELGEIEAALRARADVGGVAVAARESRSGSQRLVAYVVPAGGVALDVPAVRADLAGRLPAYMVPSDLVELAALPLTVNGKVDRRALPAPVDADGGRDEEGAEYTAPLPGTQTVVAEVWAEVLGAERVGAHQDFFTLGGDSIAGLKVVSRLRTRLGAELSPRTLFDHPTVASLAAAVDAAPAGNGPASGGPVPRAPRDGALPLSFAQERLWFLDEFAPGSGEYNVVTTLRLTGALDLPALRTAVAGLVARHEALRTTFTPVDGRGTQTVHAHLEVPVRVTEPGSAEEADAALRAEAIRPFDLRTGPLIRVLLVRDAPGASPDGATLMLTLHHIVTDGWSMGIVARELSELYASAVRGTAPGLPALPAHYPDYAAWQRARLTDTALEPHLAYWRQQLDGLPVLDLPTDRPRPAVRSGRGALHSFPVPREVAVALGEAARRRGATLSMALTAVTQLVLARHGGQSDLAVGTAVSGRDRTELEGLVGFFVNTLVLRSRIDEAAGFGALLDQVRGTTLAAFAHQEVPFSRLVEELAPDRDPSRTPLVQAAVTLQNAPRDSFALPGLLVEETLPPVETTPFDLNVEFEPRPDDGLFAVVSYSTDLYEAATVARLAGHWLELATRLATGDPERPLREVPMLGPAEQAEALTAAEGRATGSRPLPVPAAFAARVAEHPDALAVSSPSGRLTYAELDARAERLARVLAERGVTAESRVGVLLERSADLVVALLAVLKSGGAYVPLHAASPEERTRSLLARSRTELVLTDRDLVSVAGVPAVRVDTAPVSDSRPPAAPHPDSLAYVMYTSGSTGRPKGVAITHADITALAADTRWHNGAHRHLLFHSPHSFDAATYEIWAALLNGHTLTVADREITAPVVREAVASGVTAVFLTKALFDLLAEEDPGCFTGLQEVWTGGEAASPAAMSTVQATNPDLTLVHVYGPTETTTFAICGPLSPADTAHSPVPLGLPMDNTQAYVLDASLAPAPVGVPGELYLGGTGLARGYDGQPALTATRFVPDPYHPGARLYRTGDLVTRHPDGRLHFLGRTDTQVKIRGHRIEPAETEAALLGHPEVSRACVLAREDRPGSKYLAAYVVGTTGAEELRAHLARSLPEYLVPSAFVLLDALPLTPNGKVDHRALPAPDRTAGTAHTAPSTPAEETLAAIWAEVLGTERVGVHDNFFSLGGDSITSLQVVSRARRAGLALSSRDIFLRQTVAELAASAAGTEPGEASRAPQGVVSGPVGPTPVREWFFAHHPVAPAHFAMSLAFELAPGTEVGALREAVAALLGHHDALRSVFTRDADGHWAGHLAPAVDPDAVLTVHRLAPEGEREAWEELARAAQSGMDLARGPLFRVLVGERGPGRPAWLFVAAHHLLVDGVSWRVLLEDLGRAYEQAAAGSPVELGPKTASVVQWAERLARRAAEGGFDGQREYWQGVGEAAATALPVDLPGGGNTMADQATVEVALDAEETAALLHQVPEVYRTRTDDVLLTALARTLRTWTGRGRTAVAVEGHGREELFADVDLTRTVGWFTSIYPVALTLPEGDDPGAALKSVKEQLRAVPDRGIGYGVLRHLVPGGGGSPLASLPEPQLSFNYHGRFDAEAAPGAGPLRRALPPLGQDHHPGEERAHLIDVTGIVGGDGVLSFTWAYSAGLHHAATVERLARDFTAELRALVGHCAQPAAGGRTPSDFPLAGLDQAGVDALAGTGAAAAAVEDVYPLTPLQNGMLLHTLADPGVYLDQASFLLEGAGDPHRLATAWQRLVDATPALRTHLVWEDVPEPLQVVRRHAPLTVRHLDWSHLPEDAQAAALVELAQAERAAGVDLTAGPLMKLALVRARPDAVRVVWTFHHLVLDGWSTTQIFEDVFAQYAALGTDAAPAPLTRPPFREYVAWLRGQDGSAAREYWAGALAGFDAPTPLPYDRRPAPGHRAHAAARVRVELAEERAKALSAMAARHHLTLNTVVQGAWALLLARHSGEGDVCFGATTSGRPAELPGMESTVGNFLNTLPVRVRPAEEGETLAGWLGRLQEEQARARGFEHLALREVREVSELPPGAELFDSLVVFENYPDNEASAALHGLRISEVTAVDTTSYALDLTAYTDGDRLALDLSYDPALFDAGRIGHLARHLSVLLDGMPARTGLPPAALPSLTGEQEQALLAPGGWSGAPLPYPREACLHELIAAQARRTPGAEAVASGADTLTYAELEERANRLAQHLAAHGVGPGAVVAICLERGVELAVAVLAVLKAGGAYVPLDATHPAERLAYVLSDSGAALVVTRDALAARLPGGEVPVLSLDAEAGPIAARPARMPESGVTPRDLAYVIYTSGSTGRPKGVQVEHVSVVHGAASWDAGYGLTAEPGQEPLRQLNVASFSFDVFVSDLVHALCHGGTLVIAPADTVADPARLLDLLAEARITHLDTVPALLTAVAEEAERRGTHLPELRVLAGGADLWRSDDCRRLLARTAPSTTVVNGYGVTEATVESCVQPVRPDTLPDTPGVPIGHPHPGVRMYLLDAALRPVPVGVTGDLYIGGPGVGRGYRNRPGLTALRFVADPFGTEPGARLYLTGDRARYLPDGGVEFGGRADQQVKVRGFRVEPGEIETALSSHPAVAAAVVAPGRDARGDTRLVGYAVPRPGHTFDPAALRAHLKSLVPAYMVPAVLVELDALPLNSNGKVDRRALPEPDPAERGGTAYVAPRTPGEEALAGIWQEVLGREGVGAEDDFFDLGGSSVQLLQVTSRVRAAFGVALTVRDFYDAPTVAGLTAAVEEQVLRELEAAMRQ
ncbi:non-ribosomal peptide synthase/polyketide synthase [Streptomyces albidoflavus]|uniref:non-ribosomal peptide synthase/polyketide synthase n=1 Tax=Streptomyces albidoflavus TaxID=1886 RepID=UPI00344D68E3